MKIFIVDKDRISEPDILSPSEFEERMRDISTSDSGYPGCNTEDRHRAMDDLMCEILEALGYGKGVEVFKQTHKWYA